MNLFFIVFLFLGGKAHDEEGRCMYRRLGYEAIWGGNTYQTSDEGGYSKKEEIVVKPWGFPQRKLRSLGH
jgi:hypothetical protein